MALAGLISGLVVGLTGMGGGALLTPLLILFFGVPPLAAVSSDLVASAVMKPVGGLVHFRRGTTHLGIVRWLVLGSVPAAFTGVYALTHWSGGAAIEHTVTLALGTALIFVALAMTLREFWTKRDAAPASVSSVPAKPLQTVLVGVIGGLVVGITSVGSGSLIMMMLFLLYPRFRLRELVGTDLVQAVPLVLSAAVAHLLFGDFELGLTASILTGALPGVYLGAKLSSRAADHWIRPVLVAALTASGLKLLGAGPRLMTITVLGLISASVIWMLLGARRARRSLLEQQALMLEQQPPA